MKRLFTLPFSRARARRDTHDEIAFHIEGRIRELMARGLPREEAEREATARFGDLASIEAEVARIDAAIARRRSVRDRAETFAREVRYAARALARRPAYTIAVVATLALGMGAATAIFAVFSSVLIRPVASPHLSSLRLLQNHVAALNLTGGLAVLEAEDLHRLDDAFVASTSFSFEASVVEEDNGVARRVGVRTTGEFFATFGVSAGVGRVYDASYTRPGAPPVIVLSHGFWRELGGDSSIVGTTLALGSERPEIIGVLRQEFDYPRGASYWRPQVVDPATFPPSTRNQMITTFVGRMRDGAGDAQVLTALRSEERRWREEIGGYPADAFYLQVQPLVDALAGNLKPVVSALLIAVVLLLLIACANVASLQLVRAISRQRESVVRAALGAGRGALVTGVMLECALLAVGGGLLGVGLAKVAGTAIAGAELPAFPMLRGLRIDAGVVLFAAFTIVLAGVLVGTVPALRAVRLDLGGALRSAGRGASAGISRNRLLRMGVVAQFAFTLVLLAGAGLMARTLDRLLKVEPGFDPANVMTAKISMPSVHFANGASRVAALDAVQARLEAMPGVESVGFTNYLPFADGTAAIGGSPYIVVGAEGDVGAPRLHAGMVAVYGDYFRTMRIPFVQGRAFGRQEYGAPTLSAIIDDELAAESFSDRSALGASVSQGRPGAIVGVIPSVKQYDLTEPRKGIIYWTYPHFAWFQSMNIVMRSALSPDAAAGAIRAAVNGIDPRIPVYAVRPLADRVSDSLGVHRLTMLVLAGFGGAALLLALIGIYGVMSYVMGERTREVGIRVALGARRGQLIWLVLRDGATMAVLGIVLGLAVFAGGGRVLRAMLYEVSALDPASLAAAVAVSVLAALGACYVAARRSTAVDVMSALRSD